VNWVVIKKYIMEPRDNFENIALPHVRTVKVTLLRDEIVSISSEESAERIVKIRRKMDDNVYRYNGKWSNKMIHGINEKEE
jgi:hypothetical protein